MLKHCKLEGKRCSHCYHTELISTRQVWYLLSFRRTGQLSHCNRGWLRWSSVTRLICWVGSQIFLIIRIWWRDQHFSWPRHIWWVRWVGQTLNPLHIGRANYAEEVVQYNCVLDDMKMCLAQHANQFFILWGRCYHQEVAHPWVWSCRLWKVATLFGERTTCLSGKEISFFSQGK